MGTLLVEHFKPKRIVIFERYTFYSRNQKSGESVTDFLAAIRALAHTCVFGDTLDDMLRDRLVMGLHNKETQHALLSEAELTLQRAVEVSMAREAATRDIEAMGSTGVNAINYEGKGQKKNFKKWDHKHKRDSGDSKAEPPKKPCGKNHWKKDCPFANAKCYKCGKRDTSSLFAGISPRNSLPIRCRSIYHLLAQRMDAMN